MTKARDGSHKPKISRKPETLDGLSMPAKDRPTPKINPDKAAVMTERGMNPPA